MWNVNAVDIRLIKDKIPINLVTSIFFRKNFSSILLLLSSKLRLFAKQCNVSVSEAATKGILLKKVFLEILQKSQENTFARDSFLLKLQAWGLQLY